MTAINELEARINRLQFLMQANQCQGFLIIQNVDMYYFSGTIQNALLYVPAEGSPLLLCRKNCERARQECPWAVIPVDSFSLVPKKLAELHLPAPRRLALEMDVIPVNRYLFLSRVFDSAEMIDGSAWVRGLRAVKTAAEIAIIRKSGHLMARVYQEAPHMFKVGRSELECAAEVERSARMLGHQGLVRCRAFNQELFFGHILSGPSGGVSSYVDGASGGTGLGDFFSQGSCNKIIQANEPISLDYVGVFDGYAVDQTRMFVIGSLPERLHYAFLIALKIQDCLIAAVKPGAIPSDLYALALAMAEDAGLKENFMGYRDDQTKFIGHGIGLELDELPILARGYEEGLATGMVFALEPKFVFPGLGMVGIENTWLVTDSGAEKISDWPDGLVTIP